MKYIKKYHTMIHILLIICALMIVGIKVDDLRKPKSVEIERKSGTDEKVPTISDEPTIDFEKLDEDGMKKYFLTYHRWDFSRYSDVNHPDLNYPSYEAETQLTTKNGGIINLTFLHVWEPKDAEEFLEKLFETGWFRKYDDVNWLFADKEQDSDLFKKALELIEKDS